jgi:hypothetical protein
MSLARKHHPPGAVKLLPAAQSRTTGEIYVKHRQRNNRRFRRHGSAFATYDGKVHDGPDARNEYYRHAWWHDGRWSSSRLGLCDTAC